MIEQGLSVEYSLDGKIVGHEERPDTVTVRLIGRTHPAKQYKLPSQFNEFLDFTVFIQAAYQSGQYAVRRDVKSALGITNSR